jgi:hypothetical protein
MLAFWLATTLALAPEPTPAAMILDTKGEVTRTAGGQTKHVAVMSILQTGDVLKTAAGAEAVIVILSDGHRERLKAVSQITLGENGGAPAEAVVREEKAKVSKAHLDSLRTLAKSGMAAGGMFRDPGADRPSPISPLVGTTVLPDRPHFAWPSAAGATSYIVELRSGDDKRQIWQVTTKENKLSYPENQKELERGRIYRWQVTAQKGDDAAIIATGRFNTATAEGAADLAALEQLAKSDDPAAVLLAALGYEASGVIEQAIAAYEKLAAARPNEIRYHAALARYYERAGLPDKAKAAKDRVKELTPKTMR